MSENLSHLLKKKLYELGANFGPNARDLVQRIAEINQYLNKQKITPDDYLVWQCENTFSSAIAIIYFLINQYSFLLVPTNINLEIPRFCRYCLRTSKSETSKLGWTITPNPNYNGQKANPDRPLVYFRTSGTTGTPKLVVHSYDKLFKNALNCAKRLELEEGDRITIPVPIYHLFGFGAAFLPALMVGAKINLQANSNILKYFEAERLFQPNVTFLSPSFAANLLKLRKTAFFYKLTVIAGDYLKPEIFFNYQEKMGKIIQLYGSTEMGVMAAAKPQDSAEIRSSSVGKPLTGVKIKLKQITDSTGELWCHHNYGFLGYADYDGVIVESFTDDWFGTKDLGTINSEGYVKVLARSDHSVNRDGFLVLFSEIEAAITKISGIKAAIVITQGESKRGKGITACCLCNEKVTLTPAQIHQSCFDLLPRRAIPDKIIIISSLPLLPNGKIDRQKLLKLANN